MADCEADVYFYRTEEGGRRTPARSGYRPNHDFHRQDRGFNDASHDYPGRDEVAPGETATVELTLFRPELNEGRFYVGMHFFVTEGAHTVASGRITKIWNERLVATWVGK